jgi:3-methyladenine DNA glycosylase AlkC
MLDIELRNLSNIKVNKECYKILKKMSIDKEITIQKVVAELLEKITSKKAKQLEVSEE